MARVVFDAGHPLDHDGHPRQSPQLGAEAVRGGSLEQGRLHLPQLRRRQSRFAARAPGCLQSFGAALLPVAIPPTDTLPADLELTGDGSQRRLSFGEQTSGLLSPLLEGLEVTRTRTGHHDPG